MAVLHVREIPDQLYRQVQKMAQAQGRSLSAEVIAILEAAVQQQESRARFARMMEDIGRDIWTPPPGMPDAAALVHELREEQDDLRRNKRLCVLNTWPCK